MWDRNERHRTRHIENDPPQEIKYYEMIMVCKMMTTNFNSSSSSETEHQRRFSSSTSSTSSGKKQRSREGVFLLLLLLLRLLLFCTLAMSTSTLSSSSSSSSLLPLQSHSLASISPLRYRSKSRTSLLCRCETKNLPPGGTQYVGGKRVSLLSFLLCTSVCFG